MDRDSMKNAGKVAGIALCGAGIGLLLAILFPPSTDIGMHGAQEFKLVYYPVNMALSFSALLLLISLFYVYAGDYRETGARFILGLNIFLIFLIIQTAFSIPLVHLLFGFSSIRLGPFSIIPAFFETIALSIFLYLTIDGME